MCTSAMEKWSAWDVHKFAVTGTRRHHITLRHSHYGLLRIMHNSTLTCNVDVHVVRDGRTKGAWQRKRGGGGGGREFMVYFTTINADYLIVCYE